MALPAGRLQLSQHVEHRRRGVGVVVDHPPRAVLPAVDVGDAVVEHHRLAAHRDVAILVALLGELVAFGIGSVMVEGGATLITSFFRAGLVDRLAVCLAPKILGDGIEAIGDLGIRDLSRSLVLADAGEEPYGVDLILSGRVEYPDGIPDR